MGVLSRGRQWAVALALLVAAPAQAQIISSGLWYYPSGLAGYTEECRTPEVYASDPETVALIHMADNNRLTTMECGKTCRSPYTHLGVQIVSPVLAIARLRSNCGGAEYSYEIKRKPSPKPPMCEDDKGTGTFGNPCNLATGNKVQSVTDYEDQGGDLVLSRLYVSGSTNGANMPLGPKWQLNFDRRALGFNRPVEADAVFNNNVYVWRPQGNAIFFIHDAATGIWKSDPDVTERLTQRVTANGMHDGWVLEAKNGINRDIFDAAGRLVRVEDSRGPYLWLTHDTNGRLSKVTDRKGRSINFTFQSDKLSKATLPDGGEINYYYYSSGMLNWVTYPDSTPANSTDNPWTQYFYEKAGQPQLLTGIIDENGNRAATWDYDADNRVVLSVHGNASATTDRMSVSYASDGSATVTQPLGAVTTINFETSHGVRRLSGQSALCPGCNGRQFKQRTFDANGFDDVVTDFRGSKTNYDYDTTGLLVQQVDASEDTSGLKRTIQTDWDSGFRVPVQRRYYDAANSLLRTDAWTYNSRGQALTTSQSDGTVSRASAIAYCEQSDIDIGTCPLLGLVLSVDGPRSDVSDITRYSYYQSDDAACAATPANCAYRKGDLWKRTDALGRITETLRYDRAGRPLTVKDQNAVVTDYEYHPRGWVSAVKVRGADNNTETDDRITRFEYWPVGTVKRVTLPDGSFTSYAYDVAKRLTDVVDMDGNSIHYTLDASGNRKQEDTKTADGTLKRTLSRVYNQLNQLQVAKDASQNATTFRYDANGNRDRITDALGRITDGSYDPLNRLTRTLQDVGGLNVETKFQYDAMDRLTKVTDPKGLDTVYAYNGFGDRTRLTSPDTGITNFTYNAAGKISTKQDANDVVPHRYTYDALGRPKTVSYTASGPADVEYDYDTVNSVCVAGETFAVGRVTAMRADGTELKYCYDRFGQVVRKVQAVAGKSFNLSYTYTVAGRLNTVTYPDGTMVDYVRDAQARIKEIGVRPNGGTRAVLLNNATYEPVGPVSGWTYGNGRVLSRTYDLDYRAKTILDSSSGGLSLSYGYNTVGEMTELKDGLQSAVQAKYDYDTLGRLTVTRDGSSNPLETYAYDETGNRKSLLHGGITDTYAYPTTSHRLSSVAGVVRGYDAVGNTISIGGAAKEFVYNADDRLSQFKQAGVVKAGYRYNAIGQRVAAGPSASAVDTFTLYDEAGNWIGDYGVDGTARQQVVWMNGVPVGVLMGAASTQKAYFIESDRLGAPRSILDPSRNAVIWNWDSKGEAFGSTPPNQDPDLDGAAFVFAMRFPGQYHDIYSGLNFNYFRNYEAAVGRYSQSDPIGLLGGISTFAYARSNPVSRIDPYGLADIYSTLDIDLTAGMGIEINLGQVWDTDTPMDSGVYFSIGSSYGGNVGIGVGLGMVCRDIEGRGASLDLNAGKISPALSLDDKGVNGATFTVGPGAGFSASTTTTWTLSPNAIINFVKGLGD